MSMASARTSTRTHRGMLKLSDRIGDRVDCLDGSVWITQEGDPRDVVLDAGQSFTLDRGGTVIVCALSHGAQVAVQRVTPQRGFVSHVLPRLRLAFAWSGVRTAQ